MSNRIELASFAAQRGTVFQVVLSEELTLDLTLHTVEEKEAHADDFENFSLIFHSSKDALLEQNTYIVTHEHLGQTAIFLVPVGQTEEAFEYQAVFSRKKAL